MVIGLKKAGRIIVFTLFLFINGSETNSAQANWLITKLCIKGFNTEMRFSGKNPPKGMGKMTCDCFVKEISQGISISSAQSICKKEISKRFSL